MRIKWRKDWENRKGPSNIHSTIALSKSSYLFAACAIIVPNFSSWASHKLRLIIHAKIVLITRRQVGWKGLILAIESLWYLGWSCHTSYKRLIKIWSKYKCLFTWILCKVTLKGIRVKNYSISARVLDHRLMVYADKICWLAWQWVSCYVDTLWNI